jgi:isocitrate dehydrogenase
LEGGGLFETGAGGSAPKHVQQFLEEGHLRWDSLGEFLALTVSLEHLANVYDKPKAKVLAKALDNAVSAYLENKKSPSRKAGEPDNRASHYYLASYWAKALSEQNEDIELSEKFIPIAEKLAQSENTIIKEIANAEGKATDTGGYFKPDDAKAEKAMRPSQTFNEIINAV